MIDDPEGPRFEGVRKKMVAQQIAPRGVRDRRVLAAMEAVPRHLFVPDHLWHVAYRDHPLPIGQGQTISQPLMVAIMVDALELRSGDRVLDVGGGSGYQAAVLAQLCDEVVSIEWLPDLAERLRENLARADVTNVRVVVGDGSVGYPPGAPYDGIVVGAAAPAVPAPLVEQLAVGGRLVIPVGGRMSFQELLRLRRTPDGVSAPERLGACAFVPLLGEHGFRR
jgi:protein-L-isoaspartate(D-aspartate) O-methyltransferase